MHARARRTSAARSCATCSEAGVAAAPARVEDQPCRASARSRSQSRRRDGDRRRPDREDEGAERRAFLHLPEEIEVEKTAAGIEVKPRDETKKARAMWGMARTQVANLVDGVTKGYSHTLEIHGVGFRAAMKGKDRCSCRSASATM